MKIKWLNHPTDPTLNGTVQHVPRSVAEYACAVKQASTVPFPRRGAPGWIEAMAEDEALRRPNPSDVNPVVAGVEWGLRDRAQSVWSKVLIVKRVASETFFYEQPPRDCPPSIVQQWKDLTKVDASANRVAIEAAKAAQRTQQSAEKIGVLQDIYKNWA